MGYAIRLQHRPHIGAAQNARAVSSVNSDWSVSFFIGFFIFEAILTEGV